MRRVLVVEDDAEIRESLLEALADHGHPAEGAANGKAALDQLRGSELPCLILLDLMMPVMDGQTFREEQMKDPHLAQVPVVVVSADRDVGEAARTLHATAWLQKPLKVDELIKTVMKYCYD